MEASVTRAIVVAMNDGEPDRRGAMSRLRWQVGAAVAVGFVASVVVAVPAAFAQTTDSANPAVQYAESAWNWVDPSGPGAGTVGEGSWQSDFGCAEFVSRALAAAGLVPGMDQYSPRLGSGSFENYGASNGKTYNLLDVGSYATFLGVQTPFYNAGLYDYLIDTGLGRDIGSNTAAAMPGDVIFFYGNGPIDSGHRDHAALLTATGAIGDTEYTGHNKARLNWPLTNASESAFSIVRINAIRLTARVTTLEWNTSSCPGTAEYFPGNDLNGVPIDWTYANGGHPCVRVAYVPRTTADSCTFRFFVPTGDATANVIFGYWTTDGQKHYASLDEGPRDGWYNIFSSANVTSVQFQDNNGQAYPLQLGWGSDYSHGLAQDC
jgi:hypothetical protein